MTSLPIDKQYCSIGRFNVELAQSKDGAKYSVELSCKGKVIGYYEFANRIDAHHDYHMICDTMSAMVDSFRNDHSVSDCPPSSPYGIEAESGVFRTVPERKVG